MSIDVVCTGMVFLDMTFEGLNELPENGRERLARRAARDARRRGDDRGRRRAARAEGGRGRAARPRRAGAHAARALEREGVLCAGPEVERTPVTVVLPFAGDRAMITYEPDAVVDPDTIARLEPRAVVTNASQLELVPQTATATRPSATPRPARSPSTPAELERARALLMNDLEAQRITGACDARGRGALAREHVETSSSAAAPRAPWRVPATSSSRLQPPRSRPGTRRGRAICSSPATSPGT